MEKPLVTYQSLGDVGVVTLANPARRNVMSRTAMRQVIERMEEAEADGDVQCAILAAEGPAFSAGHDLAEIIEASDAERESLFALCTQMMTSIRELSVPVIAQVQGVATAAGCQLAVTCDLIVAAEEATFATPGIKIGLFCSTPAVAVSRVIGPKKTMEMLLTAEPVPADEAERIGLVNCVVPRDQLVDETLSLARKIAAASPHTVELGKRAFYEQLELATPLAYQVMERIMVENAKAPDAIEGMKAFLEKREPRWGGQ
jgi:enoyl-CoA hydratase/carnithine racemase